jgi:DNA polymerase-3 subunit alpha
MLGLYVSDHPLLGAQRSLRSKVECGIGELRDQPRDQDLPPRVVGGIVTALQRKYTKKGDYMATFVLEDLSSAIEVMVFPRTMTDYGHLLDDDVILCVKGRLDMRDDEPKLIALEITQPTIRLDDEVPPFMIEAKLAALTDDRVSRLKEILVAQSGDRPVFVHLVGQGKTTVLQLDDDYRVDGSPSLCAELRELLGPACVL